eukprot:CAMPEP_0170550162 /NCGR_PEP_ID=MMETSP0211-20121228/8226_1 /TAXON_ID=311385 /ORGANISM="Pseudokeronopsis sp., Strain OXSARD2" /LENGTH=117 /DNA_ID=CAMNT_0010856549 /DNA_START=544 /DNA_END=894 /DNA_ORIENTATION=+
MDAENLAFYHSCDAQVIKDLCAVLPRVRISILPDRLIIEPIDSCGLSALMVPSQQGNVSRILQFEAKEELESLHRVVTSINEVSHKDVASVRDVSTHFEELQEVLELPMDVPTYFHW